MKLHTLICALAGLAKHRTAKAVSFEITKNCNLHCQHCYRRDFEGEDLSDDEWLGIFRELKSKGFVQAGWVGGEPLLRKGLIDTGRKYFPINAIVTNGTIPLPKWNDTLFGVSVDGTRGVYEKVRGDSLKDQYERVRRNVLDGLGDGNRVFVLMTIHRLNQDTVEEFVRDWNERGATGVILDFYTPQTHERDDPIWLGFKERDKVIDRILELRKVYGAFLPWNTPAVLEKMRSGNCRESTEECRKQAFAVEPKSLKLSFKGNRMYPCIMGSENPRGSRIDCDRCGCIFAFPFDRQAYWASLKTVLL